MEDSPTLDRLPVGAGVDEVVKAGFDLGPFGLDDAEEDGVAEGSVVDEAVAAEGAFFSKSDVPHCLT